MANITFALALLFSAASLSTLHAQAQCDYEITVHTGPTRGPTYKLSTTIWADYSGNINTTNLVKKWGAMRKGHTYFLPNSSDKFKHRGPCLPTRWCNIWIVGKKGELNPHWYVNNITVTSTGGPTKRVGVFFRFGEEVSHTYPSLDDGECP